MSIFAKENVKSYCPINTPDPAPRTNPRKIIINFIRHKDQRYDTVGDYFKSGTIGEAIINVSSMVDERYEMLVAIHELIEMVLCDNAGVSLKEIDNFDFTAKPGSEPGMNIKAPYYKQHMVATAVEMLLAKEMNVDWTKYEEYLDSLSEERK
jgi:hypothetical protein